MCQFHNILCANTKGSEMRRCPAFRYLRNNFWKNCIIFEKIGLGRTLLCRKPNPKPNPNSDPCNASECPKTIKYSYVCLCLYLLLEKLSELLFLTQMFTKRLLNMYNVLRKYFDRYLIYRLCVKMTQTRPK